MESIKDIKNLKGKRVIVRVDFSVPLNKKRVTDDTKIKAVIPTIKYLKKRGAKVILISHFGRPGKQKNKKTKKQKNKEFKIYRDLKYSLKILVKPLEKLLGGRVKFINDCVGRRVEREIDKMNSGDVVLLENLRFYKEEEKNNKKFAENLANSGDIYIQEAFSVSHRKHASVSAITEYLPSYYGLLLIQELDNLNKLFKAPAKPYVVLLGGAKLSTKINLIKKLEKKSSKILIGGAMANVFFKALKLEVGKSLIEKKIVKEAKKIIKSKKIILPVDVVVAKSVDDKVEAIVRKINRVKRGEIILDIGPETITKYAKILKRSKTILWNGPMGKFEIKEFSNGSVMLARVIASVSSGRAYGVCGGGETIKVLNTTKMQEFVDWISTGGGAMLAYLSGEEMPGLSKLTRY